MGSYLDLIDSILLWSSPNAQSVCKLILWGLLPLHIFNLACIYIIVVFFPPVQSWNFAKFIYLHIRTPFDW